MAERYLVQFGFSLADGASAFDVVRDCASEWLLRPRPNTEKPWFQRSKVEVDVRRPGMYPQPDGGVIQVDGEEQGGAGYWQLSWDHPDGGGRDDLRWHTDIRAAIVGGRGEITVESRIVTAGNGLLARGADVDRPNLVPLLLSRIPSIFRGRPVTALPRRLEERDIPAFFLDDLAVADRQLPIVLVSPGSGVDTVRMAGRLAGLAEVFDLVDHDAEA